MDESALRDLVGKRALRNSIIVLIADDAYREVLDNWLAAAARINIDSYLVMALDPALHDYLRGKGVACFPAPPVKGVNALWRARMEMLRKIIAWGFDVIHSDADAIWVRDPLPEYFLGRREDLVITQGTVWPVDVFLKWGLVVCCGLFQIRANQATLHFMDRVLADMSPTRGDQDSFNTVLARTGVEWTLHGEYPLPLPNRQSMRCSLQPITGRAADMTVAVLPHHHFQRFSVPGSGAFVKHLPVG